MNEIYLVVGGEYSDWFIDSYFTNKDEAEKYCLVKNKSASSYEELYVKDVPLNKAKIAYDKVDMKKYWNIRFHYSDGSWVYWDQFTDYEAYTGVRKETKLEKFRWTQNILVVNCTAETEDQALKIAQDLVSLEKSKES
jgi:hypothetical protein